MAFFPSAALNDQQLGLVVAKTLVPQSNLGLAPLGRSTSVLFIDSGVADAEQLIASSAAGTAVYRLEIGGDAVAQITDVLSGMRDLASVQIVSHGKSGGLQLGSSWLDLQTLPSYVAQMKAWGQALAADADILLYGCNVAQDAAGKGFVNLLAQATGADVAASDDLTGSAALGGDWDLEVQTGDIEAAIALTSQTAYQHTLRNFNVTAATDDGTGLVANTLSWAIEQANFASGDDTVTLNSDVRFTAQPIISIDSNISFIGNSKKVSGDANNNNVTDAGDVRPFFVKFGIVVFSDLTITNGLSQGTTGGGGGAGLGGALFIYDGNVMVNNTTFSNNRAIGGNAGANDLNGGGFAGNGNIMDLGVGGNTTTNTSGGFGGGSYGGSGYGGFGGGGSFNGGFAGGNGSFTSGAGGGGGLGGAIFVRSGALDLYTVAFNNNIATGGSGFMKGQGLGGAIFALHSTNNGNGNNRGMPFNLPTVKALGITFSGNDAGDAAGNSPIGGLGTGQNNDDVFGSIALLIPAVSLKTVTPRGDEGGTLTITATLSIPSSQTVTAPLTVSGTANASDYSGIPTSVTFLPGETSKDFIVSLTDDSTAESVETIVISLGTPTNAVLGMALVQTLSIAPNDPGPTPVTTRVSVSSTGLESNSYAQFPEISDDGRYVVFQSFANNLVANDTNGMEDIFVRDLVTNTTIRASVDSLGNQANASALAYSSISGNGRYVVFSSGANNLVSGDTNGIGDIFLRDTVAGTTSRVSLSSSGIQTSNGLSSSPVISGDGRYVAFMSNATNLVAGDTTAIDDIFLRDTVSNQTTQISVSSSGTQGNYSSLFPDISRDGRYVVFESYANNLVALDTNNTGDVFVRDTLLNTTTIISVGTTGSSGNGNSLNASISADGRYVTFASSANNLVVGDTNGNMDVFVRDLVTNTTKLISLSSNGLASNGTSQFSSISGDGRFVTFRSNARNLVGGNITGYENIFLRDTVLNTTTLASVDFLGNPVNASYNPPKISADGSQIVYQTSSPNIVAGDNNNTQDIFVYNGLLPITVSLTVPDSTAAETTPASDPAIYRIQRSQSSGALTVNLSVNGASTAIANDYLLSVNTGSFSTSGSSISLTMPDGVSSLDLIMTPVDDIQLELAETLQLDLAAGAYRIDATNKAGTVSIAPNDANNAPSLTGNTTLIAVLEDTTAANIPGDFILNLFSGKFSDIDAGSSLSGVAIIGNTANSTTQGSWEYSSNGGNNWFSIGSVADNATALAISANTKVRFVPVANYNGTPPTLTLRALDNTHTSFTSDAARITIDTALSGGVTAIAATTNTISTSITAVNDAPSFIGNTKLTSINEDTTNPAGETIATLFGSSFSDIDPNASLVGVAVIANAANATTEGKWQYSADNGTTWKNVGIVGDTDPVGGTVLSATTRLRFLPVANYNGTPTGLTVRALDNTYTGSFSNNVLSTTLSTDIRGGIKEISANTSTLTTSVIAINDAPVMTAATFAIAENAPNTTIVGTITATDVEVNDILTYSITAGNSNGAFAINSTTGGITVLDGTKLNYEALRTYGLTVQAQDNGTGTLSDSKLITINVTDINEVPTITAIANQTIKANSSTVPLSFTIADPETAAGNLNITVRSDNASLVNNIMLGGLGGDRTLTLTPAANKSGSSLITISVKDGMHTTEQSFTLTVTPQLPQPDLLLRNRGSGEVAIWGLDNTQVAARGYVQLADGTVVAPDINWKIVSGQFDFNNDGIRDIVWFNSATTETAIWYMQIGAKGLANIIDSRSSAVYAPLGIQPIAPGGQWQLTAVTDLLGGGIPEFLWEDRASGASAIWQLDIAANGRVNVNLATSAMITLNDAAKTPLQTGGTAAGWKIIGVGNFDGDLTTRDLLWFNEKTTETSIWQLNGTVFVGGDFITSGGNRVKPGLGWRPVAIANIDGTGTDEILWQNGTTAATWALEKNFSFSSKSTVLSQSLTVGEQIQGLADFDLNGSLDLVVRRKDATDTTRIYYLNANDFQLSIPKATQFITLLQQTTPIITGDKQWDIIEVADFGGPLL